MFYFGYVSDRGHYAVGPDGLMFSRDRVGPFVVSEFDSGEFMPTAFRKWDRWTHREEPQSQFKITHARGWTVAASWDRSGDKRGNSNASFICEGTHDFAEMMARARTHFPEQMKRIEAMAAVAEWTEP